MDDEDLTLEQMQAREAWYKAKEAHRIAGHGEREKTSRALRQANIDVMKADTAARLRVKVYAD